MANIGFIGLGNMGLPMAVNLAKAGNEIAGFDTTELAQQKAKAEGIEVVNSAGLAAAGRDAVVTMLPNGKIALAVLDEIIGSAKPGTLVIDSSTIDVESARLAHERAAKAGLLFLDAPVSGGVGGAGAGTLTFMTGGTNEAFATAEPLLSAMGKRLVHCGGAGAGQAAKICNNMLLGISMIGACEAFALADRLGLSQQALFDVVSTSSGSCWSVNTYCPVPGVGPVSPADNDYKPGFAASLMLKDLLLSQAAANQSGQETPLGAHAAQIYRNFVDAGFGETDFSGIIRHLKSGQGH